MDQQSFLYNFLLAPRFRWWRYFTLLLIFSIVSLNQALAGYKEAILQIGNQVYWIVAATILLYLTMVYLISKLVLRYLMAGRYLMFISCILFCALFFDLMPNIVYALYNDNYNFFSTTDLIDNLSGFFLYVLCISGVIIPVFIQNWVVSNQRLNQLKVKQELSQVEQLKEQIHPDSFFKVLQRSGALVKSEPDKASDMLMKLGQLLRYQLYDCNRAQVLLTAELSFLRNFLALEKSYSASLDYSLVTTGNLTGIFMPPSVLLPFVQSVLNAFDDTDKPRCLHIRVGCLDDMICVTLAVSGIYDICLLEQELSKVRDRLDKLYKNGYALTVDGTTDVGEIDVKLRLDKM